MRHFSTTIDINAPADVVWPVMSNPYRWYEWTPSITSVTQLDGEPFAIGTRVQIRQPKLPPAIWKVTEIVPGRSFTWASSGPGFRTIGHHVVEPTPTGSRVTLSITIEGVLGGLLGSLTKGITERYIALEAKGLKARSESPTSR